MSTSCAGGGAPAAPPRASLPGELQAVLFDMDGLLVDSEPLWFETECAVMARMGGTWTRADQRRLIGGSLAHSVGYMRARAASPAPPGVVARWMVDGMVALIRARGVPLKPGAGALLAETAAAGIPTALVTSAEPAVMAAVLEVTGMSFAATVCGSDVTRAKPHPEPYLRAAQRLGAQPSRCVALDDSPTGVASAEGAGCVVIAVPSVPLPPRPGRMVVPSLTGLNLAVLQEMLTAQRPLTGKS
jgi:HAD superfamily hydrolase (TIGR01509 family)